MTTEHDRITQKYLRRYPDSKRTKSWAERMVHIQTENGVWRTGGNGYTYAHKPDAWVLPFKDAQKLVSHCGPEKQATFIAVATRATPSPAPELVTVGYVGSAIRSHDDPLYTDFFKTVSNPENFTAVVSRDQAERIIGDLAAEAELNLMRAEKADAKISETLALLENERDQQKDDEIKHLKSKLAEIEKQVPVMFAGMDEDGNAECIGMEKTGICNTPLYAHPVAAREVETIEWGYGDADELRDLKQSILQSITLADFTSVKKTVEAIRALSGKEPA